VATGPRNSLVIPAGAGPFVGLRVVEFGRLIAVPYCGQLLADCGAEVVKVEPLTGDPARGNGVLPSGDSRQFLNKNRGKRSISVDLSNREVAPVIRRLVDTADVLLANFRPGVAERLGLDYPTVSSTNPAIIYASNSAFGSEGPRASDIGVDIVLQAYSGLWQASAGGPVPLRDPVIDYAAAMLMSFGVAAALYHRARTGKGQRLDTALLQASLLLQNNHLVRVESDRVWRSELSAWLGNAFAEGLTWKEVLERRGFGSAQPYYGLLRTADGYLAVGGFGEAARAKIREIVESRSPDPESVIHGSEALRGRSTEEWLEDFEAAGIPAAPLRFPEEIFDDPQVAANGFLTTIDHPRLGQVEVLGPPLSMNETPLIPGSLPPDLGSDTRDVLKELGISVQEIARLEQIGAVRIGGRQ